MSCLAAQVLWFAFDGKSKFFCWHCVEVLEQLMEIIASVVFVFLYQDELLKIIESCFWISDV